MGSDGPIAKALRASCDDGAVLTITFTRHGPTNAVHRGSVVPYEECSGKHGSGSARCGSGASEVDPRQSGSVGDLARID